MWEAWLIQDGFFFPDGHPCSYEPHLIGLNFSEQWEAGFSLLSSRAANDSLSFLGDVKVVKGELTHIKKFKLECPMKIFKKGVSGVEIIQAWLSRVESQARDSQCWLEFVILTQKQLHHERINKTLRQAKSLWYLMQTWIRSLRRLFVFRCFIVI